MSNHQIDLQLKEAGQITGVFWAAWVEYSAQSWSVVASYHLDKPAREALRAFLSSAENGAWLNGAVASGRGRWQTVDPAKGLKCARLYVFPAQGAVLVGADTLTSEFQRIWRLMAGAIGGIAASEAQTHRLEDAMQELRNTQQELQARISAQQAAESRMMQTTKLAAVGEMAAGVAHELNNPLTTVVGFSELVLEDTPADAPQRPDLEVVLREARRARDVVRRLLDFSRRTETVRAQADINEIIVDTLALMNHLLRTSGIEIRTRFSKNLPWAMVDRNQMKQVFLNLINNAMNAMPRGGRLTIITRMAARYGAPHISIVIKDTGVGISPEHLERIFEPFFTTRAGQGGTGLGLSVTYGIVTEHGGTIEVESAQGIGSTFTVWLPMEASA